jgi:diguanylate cyclase (GGDEF)-like protein
VCARFGGEEFAIIMPGSNAESVATVAERIRERIESYRSTEPALTDVRITVSIGIGVSSPNLSPRELINRADQALYLAKRDGKNVVRAIGGDDHILNDANNSQG